MIRFEDGSTVEAQDLSRIVGIIGERARTGQPKAVEIAKKGVTIRVGNLEAKKASAAAHSNYIESRHKGWKIRVWRASDMYCCNYFCGEDVRYFETEAGDRDEEYVFKHAIKLIDRIVK